MSLRLKIGKKHFAAAPLRDQGNLPRMIQAILSELQVSLVHLELMRPVGHVGHGNDPPAQFVEIPRLAIGGVEVRETHPLAVVRGADDDLAGALFSSSGTGGSLRHDPAPPISGEYCTLVARWAAI